MVKDVSEFFVDAEMPRARVALLLEHFSHLEDGREPQRVMYPLSEVLLLVNCATIASCDDFDEIEVLGGASFGFFATVFAFLLRHSL